MERRKRRRNKIEDQKDRVYYTENFYTRRFSFLASSLRDEWKKSSV